MGITISLVFLGFALRLLYAIFNFLRHAQNARRWNCGAIPTYPGDFLGISTLKQDMRADKEKMIPPLSVAQVTEMTAREGRYVSMFGIRQAMHDTIFTCDPNNVQALLATQFRDFELGQARRRMLHSLLGPGIFTADRGYWSHCRALLRPQFTRDQISDLDLEERHVQKAFQAMPVDTNTGWTASIDIQSIFFRLTIDTATEFFFGQSVESQIAALSDSESPEDHFPYYFDRGQWYAAQRARFENFYWLVDNKESRQANTHVHDYVDRLVEAALANKDKPKEKHKSRRTALPATPHPRCWSGYHRLLAQLVDITPRAAAGHFRKASRCHTPRFLLPEGHLLRVTQGLYYLQCFLNEVLRLYPIVPINRRTAVRDTTILRGGGPDGSTPVYVRKGQTVIYSTFALHRREDIWGPDALAFNPSRWTDCRPGWNYLPFNGGPRICIGQQFALTETGYVLVRLLQRFDQIVDIQPDLDIVYTVNLTSAPGNNVTVKLHAA